MENNCDILESMKNPTMIIANFLLNPDIAINRIMRNATNIILSFDQIDTNKHSKEEILKERNTILTKYRNDGMEFVMSMVADIEFNDELNFKTKKRSNIFCQAEDFPTDMFLDAIRVTLAFLFDEKDIDDILYKMPWSQIYDKKVYKPTFDLKMDDKETEITDDEIGEFKLYLIDLAHRRDETETKLKSIIWNPEAFITKTKIEKIKQFMEARKEDFAIIEWKKNSSGLAWKLTEFAQRTFEIVHELSKWRIPDVVMDEEFFRNNTPTNAPKNLEFKPVALSLFMKIENITKIKVARLKPKRKQRIRRLTVPVVNSQGRRPSKSPSVPPRQVQAKDEHFRDPKTKKNNLNVITGTNNIRSPSQKSIGKDEEGKVEENQQKTPKKEELIQISAKVDEDQLERQEIANKSLRNVDMD